MNITKYLPNYYLVFLLSGFLFVSTIPSILGISEGSLNIIFRGTILIFSICLILFVLFSNKMVKINIKQFLPFLIFWFLYSYRLVYDLYIKLIDLPIDKSPFFYIQFAFGITLIPSICVLFIIQVYNIDYKKILKIIYIMIFISLLLTVNNRLKSDVSGRDLGDVNIGVLLFGQYGASMCILSIYNMVNKFKLFYIIGFIVGLLSVFSASSKSPLIALSLVLIIFFLLRYGTLKMLLIILGIAFIFYLYLDLLIYFISDVMRSNIVYRILYSIDNGGDAARSKLMETGLEEFYNNPMLGSAILIQSDPFKGLYPHNIIIESFMSLGIIGGGLLIILLYKSFHSSYILIKSRSKESWLALLFLQFFFFSMFSGNIFTSSLFWIFSILVIYNKSILRKI